MVFRFCQQNAEADKFINRPGHLIYYLRAILYLLYACIPDSLSLRGVKHPLLQLRRRRKYNFCTRLGTLPINSFPFLGFFRVLKLFNKLCFMFFKKPTSDVTTQL
jgi:hypothetical protein